MYIKSTVNIGERQKHHMQLQSNMNFSNLAGKLYGFETAMFQYLKK